jgi:hypothetical protein
VEVSRYRPLSDVWANVLAALICIALAAPLDGSDWVWAAEAGSGFALACLFDLLIRRKPLPAKLADAPPLPVGAVDVSDSGRDVFTLSVSALVGFVGATAAAVVLFHYDTAAVLWLMGGVAAGSAVRSVRDSRMLARWEECNGRVFIERRRGTPSWYVEDPAAAPLDAS